MPYGHAMRTDMLSRSAAGATSSAVRDLLRHAEQPSVLSLAGGLPTAALFPAAELTDHLRLSFATLEPDRIDIAVERPAEVPA